MRIINFISIFLLLSCSNLLKAQDPFSIELESVSIQDLGGIQSYAFGQSDGKWLIVGGRLDGLHQRQPFAAFDIAGHNNQLIVVDPANQQKWSTSMDALPQSVKEQLSSTNMQFYQENDYLYCLGGYGYSTLNGDHITYPNLSAIDVPSMISSIINGSDISSHVRQIIDSEFQVTGGRLEKLDGIYLLLGGQKFMGRYNPMGPDHGPGFTQEYTNAIRRFELTDNGTTISINHLQEFLDSVNLHRRDYNAEAQIMPNGKMSVAMYSGVFQPITDLPFLNSVNVDTSGYVVNTNFEQFYNHYHCPVIPLYSENSKEMHTVFLGGIAQYYDSSGIRVKDDDVPFVKTIARVSRDSISNLSEHLLPIEMPGYIGAGAEFIPNLDIPHFENEVFKLDSFENDSMLLGYIFGGINSTQQNIFFINNGTQSSASSTIYKVYLSRNKTASTIDINIPIGMSLSPNPSSGQLRIDFMLHESENVEILIHDNRGSLVEELYLPNQAVGTTTIKLEYGNSFTKSLYTVTLKTPTKSITKKLVFD